MESLDETIMAVEMPRNNILGCSYYSTQENCLFLMEDIPHSTIELLEQLKTYINPTSVLVSSRAEDEVLKFLDPSESNREGIAEDASSYPFDLPYTLELRPTADFKYETAKQKLSRLDLRSQAIAIKFNVPEDDEHGDWNESGQRRGRTSQLIHLSGLIGLDSKLTVGCAGAILSYLQRRRDTAFPCNVHETQALFRVSEVRTFKIQETMFINADTMKALQIFDSGTCLDKPSNDDAGNMSVCGLFEQFTQTQQGRALLKQYLARPSVDARVLNERLNAVEVFHMPSNAATVEFIVKCLKKIKNVRRLLTQLHKGVAGGTGKGGGIAHNIWSGLQKFAFHAIALQQHFADLQGAQELEIHGKVMSKFERYRLMLIGSAISGVVNFEESKNENRTVVKHGFNRELDKQKRFYAGLQDLLSKVARELAVQVGYLSQGSNALSVVFFPQIGFLIAVSFDPNISQNSKTLQVNEQWEKCFSSEKHAYYKSLEMYEMDDRFGDVNSRICNQEIEIIHELAQRVLEHEPLLANVSDICGEIDCLVAFSQAAKRWKFRRPEIVEQNVIRIKNGRHPLQELTSPSFIPNDACIVGRQDDSTLNNASHRTISLPSNGLEGKSESTSEREEILGPSMLLMTGPNFSGKSVFLKQVALVVYMAHIGCFIPADAAQIGITDKILTRSTTCESAAQLESSFLIELQQISKAINLATNRSLLVIDEFGKGTNVYNGVGLAAGVFNYLLGLGSASPKVLAATHFHELFENGYILPQPRLALAHMKIQLMEAESVQDQIVYLYTLQEGHSSQSFGTTCAALNGIPEHIVKMAENIVLKAARGEDIADALDDKPVERPEEELEEVERIGQEFLTDDLEGDPHEILSRILRSPTAMSIPS